MSSESKVLVVQIAEVRRHPEADRLDLIRVRFARDQEPADYVLVSAIGTWKVGDLAAYVPVDMDVPTGTGPFAFLAPKARADGFHRVRAMRLRGVFSMGLLVPVPPVDVNDRIYVLGDDVTEIMGVRKWEPAPNNAILHGDAEADPTHFQLPIYDPEPWRKYRYALAKPLDAAVMRLWQALRDTGGLVDPVHGAAIRAGHDAVNAHLVATDQLETVVAREKIHGACSAFIHDGERLWVRSKTTYKKLDSPCIWNEVAERYGLAEKLATAPHIAIYGEVYGQVQDLKYGVPAGQCRFVVFDAYDTRDQRWFDDDQLQALVNALNGAGEQAERNLKLAPEVYRGPWCMLPAGIENGPSVLCAHHLGVPNEEVHMREGVVIRPVQNRVQPNPALPSRIVLKLVGSDYLLRKERP